LEIVSLSVVVVIITITITIIIIIIIIIIILYGFNYSDTKYKDRLPILLRHSNNTGGGDLTYFCTSVHMLPVI
jgi:hypothetical protein